jgi:hypothetical protein
VVEHLLVSTDPEFKLQYCEKQNTSNSTEELKNKVKETSQKIEQKTKK